MNGTGVSRLAAAGLALILALPAVSIPSSAATPPADPEPVSPSLLTFPPAGGAPAPTSFPLERNTHIRDARLVMQGGTVETPTPYHLNATTWGAAEATAWSGELRYGAPDGPPLAYESTPFNATRGPDVPAEGGAG